jgi:hypothetical protein
MLPFIRSVIGAFLTVRGLRFAFRQGLELLTSLVLNFIDHFDFFDVNFLDAD